MKRFPKIKDHTMNRFVAIASAVVLSSCATGAPGSSGLPVTLVQGDQLKLWGAEASRIPDGVSVTAQVDRTALPRGPLREHVHAEALDASGQVLTVQDAAIYPLVALRGKGTARVSSTLQDHAEVDDLKVQLRVVEGAPHD